MGKKQKEIGKTLLTDADISHINPQTEGHKQPKKFPKEMLVTP